MTTNNELPRVTIEFSSVEKANSFIQHIRHHGIFRWDNYDDAAYDYVDVVDDNDVEDSVED